MSEVIDFAAFKQARANRQSCQEMSVEEIEAELAKLETTFEELMTE